MSSSPIDPRDIPGDIAGPGGPRDVASVVFDARHAVILDTIDVATMDDADGQMVIGLLVGGRVNRTTDRARVLYLFDPDGVAGIVTELEALMRRSGDDWLSAYREARAQRVVALKAEGAW